MSFMSITDTIRSHNILRIHHAPGCATIPSTKIVLTQSGTVIFRDPPLRRSTISKANEPARMTCITSSEADDRSAAADASTRYFVLLSTFLNTSSSCFVLITSVICCRLPSSFFAPCTSFMRSITRKRTSFFAPLTSRSLNSISPVGSVPSSGGAGSSKSCRDSLRYERSSSSMTMSRDPLLSITRTLDTWFGSSRYVMMRFRVFPRRSSSTNVRTKKLRMNISRFSKDKNAISSTS
mmetsp:Transcript_65653/g.158766  ORF Transcript_65653/g.158766 Transcript_65653/m.158766 type:complete len:237 (-) Transcript_65653:1021-1731(-)